MTVESSFIGFGLHDAVLEALAVDWLSGTVTIRLGAVTPRRERVTITAKGTVELVCPRRHPWGTGDNVNFINDVRLMPEAEQHERMRLELEMCSGDVVMVTAQSFERVDDQQL